MLIQTRELPGAGDLSDLGGLESEMLELSYIDTGKLSSLPNLPVSLEVITNTARDKCFSCSDGNLIPLLENIRGHEYIHEAIFHACRRHSRLPNLPLNRNNEDDLIHSVKLLSAGFPLAIDYAANEWGEDEPAVFGLASGQSIPSLLRAFVEIKGRSPDKVNSVMVSPDCIKYLADQEYYEGLEDDYWQRLVEALFQNPAGLRLVYDKQNQIIPKDLEPYITEHKPGTLKTIQIILPGRDFAYKFMGIAGRLGTHVIPVTSANNSRADGEIGHHSLRELQEKLCFEYNIPVLARSTHLGGDTKLTQYLKQIEQARKNLIQDPDCQSHRIPSSTTLVTMLPDGGLLCQRYGCASRHETIESLREANIRIFPFHWPKRLEMRK